MSNVASNVIATGKRPGGITGKGFQPGQSGNPTGGTRRRREAMAVGEQIRAYLAQNHKEESEKTGRRTTRLEVLIMRLEKEDPKTLLEYAFGRVPSAVDVNANVGNHAIFTFLHADEASGVVRVPVTVDPAEIIGEP